MPTRKSELCRKRAKVARELFSLANIYNPLKHNIKGWYISEKLDGVRARWINKALVSRSGNVFPAPDFFIKAIIDAIGDKEVDGELFLGRQEFQRCVSIVRNGQKTNKENWQSIQYVLFDALGDSPWIDRFYNSPYYSALSGKVVSRLNHKKIKNDAEASLFCKTIVSQGGEGAMLRDPAASYITGRSNSLLKMKPFHDMEVTVCSVEQGDGRNKNRMGALICALPDKGIVRVGSGFTDEDREAPPKIGDLITIKYYDLTDAGIPRHPVFMRIKLED